MAKFLDLEGLNYFWEKIKSWVLERFASKSDLNQKLDRLRSGQNIKTINNQTLLGNGNIEIQGGSSAVLSVNGKTGNVVLSASDVNALPSSTAIPTKVSDLNNDLNFTSVSVDRKVSTGTNIADITIDGTTTLLYAPQGGSGEENLIESISVNGTTQTITNKNVDITVPTTLASLSDDTTHRVVTDTEKSTWSGKSNFSGSYDDLSDKPTIPTVPTNVSAFNNDAGYLTQHQSLTNYVQKSQTAGLLKNDGTVDTNTYLTSHQDISGKADKITIASSMPSGGFLPNVVYNLGALSGDTTFLMAAATDNTIANIWCWTFETPSTAPTITWPQAITAWNGGSAPTINASKHYEVSVMNGIACIIEA